MNAIAEEQQVIERVKKLWDIRNTFLFLQGPTVQANHESVSILLREAIEFLSIKIVKITGQQVQDVLEHVIQKNINQLAFTGGLSNEGLNKPLNKILFTCINNLLITHGGSVITLNNEVIGLMVYKTKIQ